MDKQKLVLELYNLPQVQQYLQETVDINNIKLPYVLKNRILMSPGTWNGYHYDAQEIINSYQTTNWDDPQVTSLFLDHEDDSADTWVGKVVNPRLVGTDIVGDLEIVDMTVAQKLAYGAKFGISPKLTGDEQLDKSIRELYYNNFSVVFNPACKTTYLNSASKDDVIGVKFLQDKLSKKVEELNIKVDKLNDKVSSMTDEKPVEEAPTVQTLKDRPTCMMVMKQYGAEDNIANQICTLMGYPGEQAPAEEKPATPAPASPQPGGVTMSENKQLSELLAQKEKELAEVKKQLELAEVSGRQTVPVTEVKKEMTEKELKDAFASSPKGEKMACYLGFMKRQSQKVH